MGSPIDVGGQYPFITFFTPPRLSGKFLLDVQSTTYGHGSSTSLSYDTYYDLLINACVRYDKTKKANIGKRRNVYNTNMYDTYVDQPTACIDHVPNSPYGGIDLPPDEFYQVHTLPPST